MSSLYGRANGLLYVDEDDTLRYPFGFAQVYLLYYKWTLAFIE